MTFKQVRDRALIQAPSHTELRARVRSSSQCEPQAGGPDFASGHVPAAMPDRSWTGRPSSGRGPVPVVGRSRAGSRRSGWDRDRCRGSSPAREFDVLLAPLLAFRTRGTLGSTNSYNRVSGPGTPRLRVWDPTDRHHRLLVVEDSQAVVSRGGGDGEVHRWHVRPARHRVGPSAAVCAVSRIA